MDRRTVLAILLIMIVAVIPSLILRPKPTVQPEGPVAGGPDSARALDTVVAPPPVPSGVAAPAAPAVAGRPDGAPGAPGAVNHAERLVTVESPLYQFVFSSRGGRLVGATLKRYRSFAPGDSGAVQLMPDASEFLAYRLVLRGDTVPLADWTFEPSAERLEVESSADLEWTARRGGATVRLRYRFDASEYVFGVQGDLRGTGVEGALVLVGLGPEMRMVESDSVDDRRGAAIVTKARSTEKVNLSSLDPAERQELAGPFEWMALKSKYFLTALLTLDPGSPQLGGAVVVGGARAGKQASRVHAVASLPAPGGIFSHAVYVGPQEYSRLSAIGHDLNDVNPYGWVFRPIIQPFSVLIVRIMLWMHQNLSLAYGWVVVVFGVLVRVVLWPLNQKAMRSAMAMQAIQPELKLIQEKHKNDSQKLQQEMMGLYKKHNVSPLGGCLPMLIPMPVLFALFFVFANTIEFRGVPFFWLPDLSRADPLYIIPVVMGLSMFVVSKIGQIGVPPNPQAKMMLYFMPVLFTFMLLRFSSGLNLYYTVGNLASIPQQWLISRERLRRLGKLLR